MWPLSAIKGLEAGSGTFDPETGSVDAAIPWDGSRSARLAAAFAPAAHAVSSFGSFCRHRGLCPPDSSSNAVLVEGRRLASISSIGLFPESGVDGHEVAAADVDGGMGGHI